MLKHPSRLSRLAILILIVPTLLLQLSCDPDGGADYAADYAAALHGVDLNYDNGHALTRWAAQRDDARELEDALYAEVSTLRASYGWPALQRSDVAEALARGYARHMAEHGFFAHLDPEGDYLGGRATRVGIYYINARENLQYTNYPTAPQIVGRFLISAPHRENLLAVDVNCIGIGVHRVEPVADEPAVWFVAFEFFYLFPM